MASPANLIAIGDSITAGFNNLDAYTNLMPLTSYHFSISNMGIFGETMATMLADFSTQVTPNLKAGQPNVIVVWGGTNDIAAGATASSVYANIVSYCANVHSAGALCIVPTMLSRNGFDTQKNSLNALILANTAGADGIANFTGTPLGIDGGYTNTTWFQADGIHPTQAAITTYEAPVITSTVNGVI